MKFEEISKELNIPLWKVRNIYFSALKKIKNNLEKNPEEKEKIKKLLSDCTNNIHEVNLIQSVLYDQYGREKL
jgi:DNA-directed RNA polymerase sigma subunit (sigma70/sigma32)